MSNLEEKVESEVVKEESKKNVLREAFLPEESGAVKDYLINSLLVPILKKGAIELTSSLANAMRDYILDAVHTLLGEKRKRDITSSYSSRISYNEMYRRNLARLESRYREGRDSDVM